MTMRETLRRHAALIFALVVLAVFLYGIYEIQLWSTRSRLFATVVTIPAIALAAIHVGREFMRRGWIRPMPKEAIVLPPALMWFAGFFASMWLIGMMLTIPLYTAAYLRFGAGEALPKAVVYALVLWVFSYTLFVQLLHIPLPTGFLRLPAAIP